MVAPHLAASIPSAVAAASSVRSSLRNSSIGEYERRCAEPSTAPRGRSLVDNYRAWVAAGSPISEAQRAQAAVDPATGKGKRHNMRRELGRLLDSYRSHAAPSGKVKNGYRCPPRLALCGREVFADWVELWRTGEGREARAWTGGVVRCHTKACPVCLARRRTRDGEEVSRTAQLWHDDETNSQGALYLATLTIRHWRTDKLQDTYAGTRDAWAALTSGRAWVDACAEWGLAAWIVREEATHGTYASWHPHLHVLWFLPKRINVEDVAAWLFVRWRDCVERVFVKRRASVRMRHAMRGRGKARAKRFAAFRGAVARVKYARACDAVLPWREKGVDLHETTAAEYVAKLGFELSGDVTKQAADGHRTPLQVLKTWQAAADWPSLRLYQEFELATHGRRDLSWSAGLRGYRDRARVELDDLDREKLKAATMPATMPASIWMAAAATADATCDLLDGLELAGLNGMLAAMDPDHAQAAAAHTAETFKTGRRLAPDPSDPIDPDDTT